MTADRRIISTLVARKCDRFTFFVCNRNPLTGIFFSSLSKSFIDTPASISAPKHISPLIPEKQSKYDIFKSGGGKKISDDLGVPFLGSIPIDPMICKDSDKGNPFVVEHSISSATEAFMNIVEKIETYLEKKNKETIIIKISEKNKIG